MVVAEEKCFLSGVVEVKILYYTSSKEIALAYIYQLTKFGFYGRPWTCSQRKELFLRMRNSNLNTYIYAPKDDVKHRALWRQLYSRVEEEKIKLLIDAAAAEGVNFVYAISPGLDISFASAADVTALKRKMKQVNKLGCKAFALLFDDINPTLKPADAAVFSSSAAAQASLTNELYTYLKKPQFLFCPTEYCKTRALPTVSKSEYLLTLGQELIEDIDIMWTGDKVIPETITKESIQELGEVLRRKPVIWDNIHANDYDQRRVFLGAYCGRPVELYPYLNGILTNPNCEFEANYIPIHTLGTWCRIALCTYGSQDDGSFDDVPMTDLTDEDPTTENCSKGNPDIADDMLPPLTAADVTSVVAEYCPKEALKLAIQDWVLEFSIDKKAPLKSYSKRNLKSTIVNGQTVLTAIPYDLDIVAQAEETSMENMSEDKTKVMNLTDDSIKLFTDLFCLPYFHGEFGQRLLNEFQWLLSNVTDIYEQPPSKEKVSRWYDRLLRCDEHCQEVYDLFLNFCKIPNEAILYDLYPYIWDLKEVVLALDSYVHWLSDSITANLSLENVQRNHGPEFPLTMIPAISDYTEPWHINYLGGLTVALHRLLPFKGGYLFLDQAPDKPSNNIIKIRPYSVADKGSLEQFCSMEEDEEMLDLEKIELESEKEIGAFRNICPKTLFVVEDIHGLCGYFAAVPNNANFADEYNNKWIPMLSKKLDNSETVTPLPEFRDWHSHLSSHIGMKLSSRVRNECIIKRILNSVLSILKTAGSTTVYHHLRAEDDLDLFVKLGFYPVENVSEKLFWRHL